MAMISSARDSIASAIFKSARWRSDGVESRHSGKALAAADIALSTSAALEFGAVANALPVAGFISVVTSPEEESTSFPFTKFCSFFILIKPLQRPYQLITMIFWMICVTL